MAVIASPFAIVVSSITAVDVADLVVSSWKRSQRYVLTLMDPSWECVYDRDRYTRYYCVDHFDL